MLKNQSLHTLLYCYKIATLLNNQALPSANEVKYLWLTFEKRLTWRAHIKTKRVSVCTKLLLIRSLWF